MAKESKFLLIWLFLAFIVITMFYGSKKEPQIETIPYSTFYTAAKEGKVTRADLKGNTILFEMNGSIYQTASSPKNLNLDDKLSEWGVTVTNLEIEGPGLGSVILSLLPILFLIGAMVWIMRKQMGGGKGGAMSFGKSKAKYIDPKDIETRFSDVAGCDEAIAEVKEVVEYTRNPEKFQKVGAKIPTGILMTGPSGTGKTLLARAMAGEAGIPFFATSGSEFVEMFVGVGASRVRDMFAAARAQGGAILFIDEIDAIGKARGGGLGGGGNDEREQTLNQILVEMDGFDGSESVIVVAATNRPEILDKALLRPGRFDRQVVVGLPDVRGREAILKVHAKGRPINTEDVDFKLIAQRTPGMSGADLANALNEAAIFAARREKDLIDNADIESAIDKVTMGPERKSMIMTEDQRESTAWHESAHALVGYIRNLQGHHDPVHRVSIMPRGNALGVTMYRPDEDRLGYEKGHLLALVDSLHAGRLGELVHRDGNEFGVSTGASNDLERASDIVRRMIKEWGFSNTLGTITAKEDLYGRNPASAETLNKVDAIASKWLNASNSRSLALVNKHKDLLKKMSDKLMEIETIDHNQIGELFSSLNSQYGEKKFEDEIKNSMQAIDDKISDDNNSNLASA